MFNAALFRIAKVWEQPKCPSTDEWIKRMWYMHTNGISFIHEKGNFAVCDNMDVDITVLSEIRQKEKYCMTSLRCRT